MCVFSYSLFKLTLFTITTLSNAFEVRKELKAHPNWRLLDRGDDCGHGFSDRIIGGEEASLGQYPWIALIGYSYHLEPSVHHTDAFLCGATIISDRYVLTAAHCNSSVAGIALVSVRVGEHLLNHDPDCKHGVCAPPLQDIEVENILCHPGFIRNPPQDDICLLRLAKPIKFNDYVYPICLPTYDAFKNNNFENMFMDVAGWGISNILTEQKSDVLLTVKVPVFPVAECILSFQKQNYLITQKQLCAGGVIGKDSCGGDSGGPLMSSFSMGSPPRYFLIGIVSYGPRKCGQTPIPGVYTKVSEYLEWILDNVKE